MLARTIALYPAKRPSTRVRASPREDAMFKRGKAAGAGAGRPAKIGALASLGGLLGGLLFRRKRNPN